MSSTLFVSSPSTKKAHLWRLPVPDLQRTLKRYLTSLEPFLLDDETNGIDPFEDTLDRREQWCQAFIEGKGRILQQRLRVLDKQSPQNWLDDNVWLKVYHQWRVPLVVNSNWWAAFQNDKNIPVHILSGDYQHDEIPGTGLTNWQVKRAAWLIHRVVEFKTKVDRQELHPETTPEGVWLQSTFRRMYNTARLPKPVCDVLSDIPPPDLPAARAILLSIHDLLYNVEVLDEQLRLLSANEIRSRVMSVIHDVAGRQDKGENAVPVCVLSADERDRWTENQKHLLSLSPHNHTTLEAINHSLFALSLDHYTYISPPAYPTPPPSPSLSHPSPLIKPDSTTEIHDHLQNLRSSRSDQPARNRWHDKTFTLVVEANTRAGAVGEHSPVDALVPNLVGEYACREGLDESAYCEMDEGDGVGCIIGGWRRLDWVVDGRIRRECVEAEERARRVVQNSDAALLVYDAYGRDYIRNEAGFPSDAYVQMSIQLAYYKIHKSFTATYETALTRMFKNGRTEAIRSFTKDSRAWVLAMSDSSTSTGTRHTLLQTAIGTHATLSRAAASGQGIDRHLLGLCSMLVPWDGAPPELLADELFTRSQTWKLSTSSMNGAQNLRGTGFGAVEEDGYGINYIVKACSITFGIESKRSCPATSSQGLVDALREALGEMRALCAQCPKPPQVDERREAKKELDEFLAKVKVEK